MVVVLCEESHVVHLFSRYSSFACHLVEADSPCVIAEDLLELAFVDAERKAQGCPLSSCEAVVEFHVHCLVVVFEVFFLAYELVLASFYCAFLIENYSSQFCRSAVRCPSVRHKGEAVVAELRAVHEEEIALASLHTERIAGVSLGDDRISL